MVEGLKGMYGHEIYLTHSIENILLQKRKHKEYELL